MEPIIIILLALAIDLSVGEYPAVVHPVVWMGKVIQAGMRLAPRRSKTLQFLYGMKIVLATIAVFALATYFALAYLRDLNTIAYVAVAAILFKSTFAIKELRRVAIRIRGSLLSGNLDQARQQMRALVKRDTTQLDEAHVVSATVESVSENTADSVVAPWFFFLLLGVPVLGVPGAMAYRVVNTFDAMIGYHGEHEYLGKFAARLDTVLNFIPSRLSGLLLVAAAYLCRRDGGNAWRVMWRDHGRTESPNAGWPMSAAAGALGVQLEKIGHYTLGDTREPLTIAHISQGVKLVDMAFLLWAVPCLIVEVIYLVATTSS